MGTPPRYRCYLSLSGVFAKAQNTAFFSTFFWSDDSLYYPTIKSATKRK